MKRGDYGQAALKQLIELKRQRVKLFPRYYTYLGTANIFKPIRQEVSPNSGILISYELHRNQLDIMVLGFFFPAVMRELPTILLQILFGIPN